MARIDKIIAKVGERADEIARTGFIQSAGDFNQLLEALARNNIELTSEKDRRSMVWAIALSEYIKKERNLAGHTSDLNFADPLVLATELAQYSNTDSPSIIAALLYSSLRDIANENPQKKKFYFRLIKKLFNNEVCDIVRDTLNLANERVPVLKQESDPALQRALERKVFNDMLSSRRLKPPDERVLLIRLTEWRLYTRTLGIDPDQVDAELKAINGDPQGLEAYLRKFDEQNIDAYFAETGRKRPGQFEISKTRNLYIPLAETFHLRLIRSHIGDEWLRMAHPRAYVENRAKILAAAQVMPEANKMVEEVLAKTRITLPNGREVALDEICEVERRLKSAASIYENTLLKKTSGDLSDIVGYRLIIDAPGMHEETATRAVYEAIKNAPGFTQIAGRHKDYIKNPKKSGYRALHDCFTLNGGTDKKIEIQFVGRQMYVHNEGDPDAMHTNIKRNGRLLEDEDDLQTDFRRTARMVTIFTKPTDNGRDLFQPQHPHLYKDSARYQVRFGSTAADMLRFLRKNSAKEIFKVAKIEITRGSSFRLLNEKIDPLGFNQLLASSDEIKIDTKQEMLHDAEHREHIINAVTDPFLQMRLMATHIRLSLMEIIFNPDRPPPQAANQSVPPRQNNAA